MKKLLLILLCFTQITHATIIVENFKVSDLSFELHHNQIKKPLLVLIHGCKQNKEIIKKQSHYKNYLKKFHLLIPDQNPNSNPLNCWNWFSFKNKFAFENSETSVIFQAISKSLNRINTNFKTTLVGFSSGAATVINLFYNYPHHFHRVISLAGLPFNTNYSIYDAKAIMENPYPFNSYQLYYAIGPKRFDGINLTQKKIYFLHGKQDHVVNIKNNIQAIKQITSYLSHCFTQDCQKEQDITYKTTDDFSQTNIKIRSNQIKNIIFDQMDHQWPGGHPQTNYSAPEYQDIILKLATE